MSKRSADSGVLPHWGRSRTSLTSGGTRLAVNPHASASGFFVEDITYRPKKKRRIVRWQPRETEDNPPVDACDSENLTHQSACAEPPVFYHDLDSELNASIQYDMGYTPQDRERKVLLLRFDYDVVIAYY